MPRPSFLVPAALTLFAVLSLTGCKTIYSDTYSPRRNHFKPEKDTPKPTELLPAPKLESSPVPAPAPAPGMEPAAPAPAAPAPGAPPAIPGL